MSAQRETEAERRERRDREHAAGLAFSQTLRENLEAKRIRIEDLMDRSDTPGPAGEEN